MTINSKEFGMTLQYRRTISSIKMLLQQYNLPDSTIYWEASTKLVELEKWIEKTLPKAPGLYIDVVGQTHEGGPVTDMSYQAELLSSQSLIKNILLSNKYTLIGSEGDGSRFVTSATVLSGRDSGLGYRQMAKIPETLTTDDIYSFYGTYGQPRSAIPSLMFLPDGFDSKVTGIEDSTMYALHGMVLTIPAFSKLNELMTTMRSYVAFFKMVEELSNEKDPTKKKAVIVIGSMHLRDFVWMARSTGVNMDFYYTSSGDFFRKIATTGDSMME